MPVPVSITNPNGVGLKGSNLQQVATEGPFERMARLAKEQLLQPQPSPAPVQQPEVVMAPPPQAASLPATQDLNSPQQPSLVVDGLTFTYPGLDGRPLAGVPPLISGMSFQLQPGSCCLLLGANGAGKTTLLKILGGKHMVSEDSVRVLGRPPFHDTQLTSSGDLAYVGGNWQRDVAFAGYAVPLTGDFPAQRMIDSIPGVDPARKAQLIKVLDVDPAWRMHQVSDGQRRRVQLCVGLLKPFKVLLLDEITVDLDVLGRADLMNFLKEECKTRGASIIYATHIFDGLEDWPTHLAYVARGQLQMFKPASEVPELHSKGLLNLVVELLQEDKALQIKMRGPRPLTWDPSKEGDINAGFSYAFNNGWVPGTMNSSLSTNAVMRM